MIKSIALFSVIAVMAVSANAAALPGNADAGKKIHEANCLSCHDSGVYQRKDRMVRDFDGLNRQINNCGHAIDSTLEKTQINDLVKYLNETYYKFK